MPIIPEFTEGKNPFPDAPPSTDVRPERFGRDAEAMAGFGGAVAQFGNRLVAARKQAMEADSVANQRAGDVEWLSQTENELRLSYVKTDEEGKPMVGPDGQQIYDVEGFSDELKVRLDERMADGLKAMPTGDAQRAYRSTVQPMFERSYVGGVQWENITRAQTYQKNLGVRISSNANLLINNPNLENVQNTMKALREDINSQVGTTLSPQEGQELYRAGTKTYVDALFRGYAQSSTKAKEGLAILNHISEMAPVDPSTGELIAGPGEENYPDAGAEMGKDAEGRNVVSGGGTKRGVFGYDIDPTIVQQALAPDDIDRIRQRLLSVVDEGDKFKAAELRSQVQSVRALLTDPKLSEMELSRLSQVEKRRLVDGMDSLAKQKKISQAEADDAAITVALGEAYAQVRTQMWAMSPSQMKFYEGQLQKEFDAELKLLGRDSRTFSYEHNRTYRDINAQIMNKVMAARKKDPAGYIEEHFSPQAKGRITQDGIPDASRINWRRSMAKNLEMGVPPLTGSESSTLIKRMKVEAEKNPEAAAATLARIKEHPYAGQIMQQLTGRGGLDKTFENAFYAASDDAAASMISNSNKENKDALIKSITVEEKKQLKDLSTKEFATTKAAFNATGPWARNNRFTETLKESIMLEAINIKNQGDTTIEEAYKQASDKIVNQNYHIVGTTFIPRQIGDTVTNENYIKGEMDAIHIPDFQKKLGLRMPGGSVAPGEDPKKAKEMNERSLKLSIERGRWVTRPDTLGARFMIKAGNKWIPLLKQDGTTVDIDFKKSSISPSQEAIEANKTWFDKFLGK